MYCINFLNGDEEGKEEKKNEEEKGRRKRREGSRYVTILVISRCSCCVLFRKEKRKTVVSHIVRNFIFYRLLWEPKWSVKTFLRNISIYENVFM